MKSTFLEKVLVVIGVSLAALTLASFAALILSLPIWGLWNWLMPEIFGLNSISVTQAFGMGILSSLLFKSSPSTSK